jgi:hypothetical protein
MLKWQKWLPILMGNALPDAEDTHIVMSGHGGVSGRTVFRQSRMQGQLPSLVRHKKMDVLLFPKSNSLWHIKYFHRNCFSQIIKRLQNSPQVAKSHHVTNYLAYSMHCNLSHLTMSFVYLVTFTRHPMCTACSILRWQKLRFNFH